MIKKLLLLALLTAFIIQLQACGVCRKKQAKEHSALAKPEQKTVEQKGILVVSFISFGGGIDFKAVPEFEQFLKDYNSRSQCGFAYEVKNWGREGERDYCFTSNNKQCFADFVTSIKNKYKTNDRILIKEDGKCRS